MDGFAVAYTCRPYTVCKASFAALHMQNLRSMGENDGMKLWGGAGDPMQFPKPLPGCLYRVLFRRYTFDYK